MTKFLLITDIIAILFCSSGIHSQQLSFQIEGTAEHRPYINYKVRKSETLFSISRNLGFTVDELIQYNGPGFSPVIMENQYIKIPVSEGSLSEKAVEPYFEIYYDVQAKDNLFGISHRILGIPLSQLQNLNNSPVSIQIGDRLLIGYLNVKFKTEDSDFHHKPTEKLDVIVNEPIPESAKTYEFTSRGLAIKASSGLGVGRLFALHNKARIDSYVLITNPILNRTISAKVIGRIPPVYEKSVEIVVSPEAGNILGAVDHRFFVSLQYN